MAARIFNLAFSFRAWKDAFIRDTRGQDILEYALFCAAICTLYAAVSPQVATSVSTIFSKINSSMSGAAATS